MNKALKNMNINTEEIERLGQMFMDIGKLVALQQRKMDLRYHFRELQKDTGHNLEGARKDAIHFGMYEDCGEFYESAYQEAKGLEQGVKMFRQQIVRLEKYQKMLTHRFKENYPATCVKLLEQELDKGTKETYKYLAEKAVNKANKHKVKRN